MTDTAVALAIGTNAIFTVEPATAGLLSRPYSLGQRLSSIHAAAVHCWVLLSAALVIFDSMASWQFADAFSIASMNSENFETIPDALCSWPVAFQAMNVAVLMPTAAAVE